MCLTSHSRAGCAQHLDPASAAPGEGPRDSSITYTQVRRGPAAQNTLKLPGQEATNLQHMCFHNEPSLH